MTDRDGTLMSGILTSPTIILDLTAPVGSGVSHNYSANLNAALQTIHTQDSSTKSGAFGIKKGMDLGLGTDQRNILYINRGYHSGSSTYYYWPSYGRPDPTGQDYPGYYAVTFGSLSNVVAAARIIV